MILSAKQSKKFLKEMRRLNNCELSKADRKILADITKMNQLENKKVVSVEWLPALLADYYDWLEGIKGQTYETRKGDEKFPPRIQTALMFLRGTKFWKEAVEKEASKK